MNNFIDYYNYMNNLNSEQGQVSALNFNKSQINNFNSKFDYTTEPNIAFMRGNLFNNLYTPYKNFKPMDINPNSEKEYALLLVQMYCFAAHELNLYLDVNPNDSNAINLRNNYINMYKKSVREYENKFGPLGTSSKVLNGTPWAWNTNKWPWEGNK